MLMTWAEFKTKYKPFKEAVEYIDALGIEDCMEIFNHLIRVEKTYWATWLLNKQLPISSAAAWAIFCADIVLPFFEAQFPADNRPRKAIEKARELLTSEATSAAYRVARDNAQRATIKAYIARDNAQRAFIASFTGANVVRVSSACAAASAAFAAADTFTGANVAFAAMSACKFNPAVVKAIIDEGFRLLEEANE